MNKKTNVNQLYIYFFFVLMLFSIFLFFIWVNVSIFWIICALIIAFCYFIALKNWLKGSWEVAHFNETQ